MTYRERRLAKVARLRTWAEKREVKAEALLKIDEDLRHDWQFTTQPGIARLPAFKRMQARSERAYEITTKGREMASRASGIETATDRAIYSDDDDAIKALTERIAGLETERSRMHEINREIKKGANWFERLNLTDAEKRDLKSEAQFNGVLGYPSYAFTNLGGNINRNKKRLEALLATSGPQ